MLTKFLKISLPVLFSLFLFVLFIFPFSVKAQPPEGKVPINAIVVEPVNGITVGPGKKLWVFAFPARGGNPNPGPPDGRGGGPGDDGCPADPCFDDDSNPSYSRLGFKIPSSDDGGLTVNINRNSIPIDEDDAIDAIMRSFNTWLGANWLGENINLPLTVETSGGTTVPAEDGIHTVGWVRMVPRWVLAATWVWTENNILINVDTFFNLYHEWAVEVCGGPKYDIEGVCTHEAGHIIGLAHFSDECEMATMYPSASKGEIKKQTLTDGEKKGAVRLYP